MKKIYLTLFLSAVTFCAAFSQGVSVGLRAGMNIANQSQTFNGGSLSADAKVGLMAGAYVTIMASEKFGVQPELLFSQLGTSFSSSGTTVKANFNYLSIPIVLRYNITKNFNLQAGPQLGILLSATQSSGSASVDIKDLVNGADIGGAFGLGVDFGKFNAGARYYLRFSNLEKNPPQGSNLKVTNNAIQLFVGYKLFGK